MPSPPYCLLFSGAVTLGGRSVATKPAFFGLLGSLSGNFFTDLFALQAKCLSHLVVWPVEESLCAKKHLAPSGLLCTRVLLMTHSMAVVLWQFLQKEIADEKRQRKQALKDERRDRRLVKKATKNAFKGEEKKQKHTVDSNPRHGLKVSQLK